VYIKKVGIGVLLLRDQGAQQCETLSSTSYPTMGNTIAKSIAEQTRKVQEEMQEKMAKIQMENMIKGQERQRRMMIAQQIAVSR
jgi:hypothetical protein